MGVKFELAPMTADTAKCVCLRCKVETRHKIIADFHEDGELLDDDGYSLVYWSSTYRILQCAGCDEVVFEKRYWDSEGRDFDGTPFINVHYFPPRPVVDSMDFSALPENVDRIYSETLEAISGGLPILAAIGIRALLEAICKERSATGASLEQKIDSLVPMGIVTSKSAEMLHSLRTLGNKAAHEVDPASPDEIKAAFAIVSHMLHGTYELPSQIAGILPAHMPRAKKAPKGPQL